jgi:hypothetical protein
MNIEENDPHVKLCKSMGDGIFNIYSFKSSFIISSPMVPLKGEPFLHIPSFQCLFHPHFKLIEIYNPEGDYLQSERLTFFIPSASFFEIIEEDFSIFSITFKKISNPTPKDEHKIIRGKEPHIMEYNDPRLHIIPVLGGTSKLNAHFFFWILGFFKSLSTLLYNQIPKIQKKSEH